MMEALVPLGVLAATAWYVIGLRRLWATPGGRVALTPARAASFAAALLIVAGAELPPVHTAAERSFAGHMVQHMLLILGAAPLLAAGACELPFVLAAPPRWRRRPARLRHRLLAVADRHPVGAPVAIAVGHVTALWAWHLPAAYDAALRHASLHAAEHAAFLVTAWLLWSQLLGHPARVAGGLAILYVFITAIPSTALGALLTLSPAPLYLEPAAEAGHPPPVTLADQQLAGLIMWVPADVVYLLVAATLFLQWLRHLDHVAPPGPVVAAAASKELP